MSASTRRLSSALLALLVAVAVLLVGAPQASAAPPVEPPQSRGRTGETVPGAYVVTLKQNSKSSEVSQAYSVRPTRSYQHAINGFAAELTDKQVERLSRDPRVRSVEPDQIVTVADTTQTNNMTWGIDRIDQRSLPLSNSYRYLNNAAGVKVYVLDTGVRADHLDFGGRVTTGYDVITPGGTADDCNGHGTHVAGTAAGTYYGVAKGATVVPVRVLGCDGKGTISQIVSGMDWVISNHPAGAPAVANISIQAAASTSLDDAVARTVTDGVVVVVAAGNENKDACQTSPARAPNALTVAASNNTDTRWELSNWGTCVDTFAPGQDILSAYHTAPDTLAYMSGTSMAAPHVSGAAAMHLVANPTHTPAQVSSAILGGATTDTITAAGTGSPNLLLYTLYALDPAPSTTTSTGCSDNTILSVCDDTNVQVSPGTLSIHDGLVADFPTLALTGAAQKATAGMAPFEVRDLRGTGAGYTVTAQATAFKRHDGSAYLTPDRAFPAGCLDYAGVAGVTADGTDSTAPTAATGPLTIDSGGAVQVVSAASGAGMGIFDFASSTTAAMTLTVPGDAYAGTYRSDVTLSLVSGPA